MSTKTTKTAKTVSKFEKLLTRKGDAIIDARASRVLTAAKNAQESIVRDLVDEVNKLEDKREAMLDMSPDNRYSLSVGKDFDAKQWTKDYHNLSIQIANKKIELEIAEENSKDLF